MPFKNLISDCAWSQQVSNDVINMLFHSIIQKWNKKNVQFEKIKKKPSSEPRLNCSLSLWRSCSSCQQLSTPDLGGKTLTYTHREWREKGIVSALRISENKNIRVVNYAFTPFRTLHYLHPLEHHMFTSPFRAVLVIYSISNAPLCKCS